MMNLLERVHKVHNIYTARYEQKIHMSEYINIDKDRGAYDYVCFFFFFLSDRDS